MINQADLDYITELADAQEEETQERIDYGREEGEEY